MQSVDVIVVNWNGRQWLDECLESLQAQTHPCRVVLVDNGSSDGSVELVRQRFPEIEIVALRNNQGFAGGNLEGLAATRSDFIAVLNNDARADPKWLEHLVLAMQGDREVGICASMLLLDGSGLLNGAGIGITTAGVGFDRGFGCDVGRYRVRERVFGACGAAALYRRQMLDEIGFFDDEFFLYDEDVDLSFRAQLAGWKCVFVPEAIVHHRMSASVGRLSWLHAYYHARNLEFVWIKNMPSGLMVRYAHHKLIQEIGNFCYLCLRHGRWGAYFRAKADAVRMLRRMLAKRRKIQRQRRVSDRYVAGLMTSLFEPGYIRAKFRQMVRG
ncbi:MAG TPA: glycosyltransferase family 2 protein [Nitrospiraceae bacterium]|nr:glycosyltransferase family 2 protein [Nitrospiraceae bacterium]